MKPPVKIKNVQGGKPKTISKPLTPKKVLIKTIPPKTKGKVPIQKRVVPKIPAATFSNPIPANNTMSNPNSMQVTLQTAEVSLIIIQ